MFAVILSGGIGGRLWPVSTKQRPKPFMPIRGESTIFGETLKRLLPLRPQGILNITGAQYQQLVSAELDKMQCFSEVNNCELAMMLEPFGRGTAAAVAMATLWVVAHADPGAVILVLPSDHMIDDQAAFAQAYNRAEALANEGRIVTFGIKPSAPETGYGYIKFNGTIVEKFVEKPVKEVAEQYIADGGYLWNSGMFCFKAETMLDEMSLYCPDILASCKRAYDGSQHRDNGAVEIDAKFFGAVRDDTIDYAVMEKSAQVSVVPCDIGWSDIGSWTALAELHHVGDDGNTIIGNATIKDSKNCYVQNNGGKTIAILGCEDLVVVQTKDATLVVHKDHVQAVRSFQDLAQAIDEA